MTIRFVVVGRLAGAGSKTFMPRGGKAGGRPIAVPASKFTKGWMDSVRAEAAVAARKLPGLIRGPVAVIYTFYCPRPKGHYNSKGELRGSAPEYPYRRKEPDWDKLCRSTSDAMTGIVWQDDKQVILAHVSVEYGEPMRAEITVKELVERGLVKKYQQNTSLLEGQLSANVEAEASREILQELLVYPPRSPDDDLLS